jgi:hypothetical protein
LELVDQGNESWWVHFQGVGQLALALTGGTREQAEHSGLGRRERQRSEAFGECGTGVRAELREQERGAALARGLSVIGHRGGHRLERIQTFRNEYKL